MGPDEEGFYYGYTQYGILRLNSEDWSELLYTDIGLWVREYKVPQLGEEFTEDHQISLCVEMIKMYKEINLFTGFDLCKNKKEQNKHVIALEKQIKEDKAAEKKAKDEARAKKVKAILNKK